jgi:hypothetical protein
MTNVNIKNSVIALAIGIVMVSCGGGNQQSGTTTPETKTEQKSTSGATVKFVSVEVHTFNKERGTAQLNVELDKPVPLMLRDVTVSTGEVSLVQCSSGDTRYWRIDIEGLSLATTQEVSITIKEVNHTFEPSSRTVKIN